MIPKEKANELINKYFNAVEYKHTSRKLAKKLAAICVAEIIELDCLTDEGWLNVPDEYKVQYWRKVIVEINAL
jgi:hypothetical protein